jgi:cell division protein FtsA
MGGSSTDYVVLRGQSVIYEGHIPVGSKHIDSDIAIMKNISVETAEILKIKYGRLVPLDDENIKKISVPKKNSDEKEYIYMEEIKNIIHARVEELLVLVYDDLKDSNMISKVGDGVVITGGLASLSGLRELTSKVFNLPVSIGVPKDINGSGFDELSLSSVVGTIHYASNLIERLELDSNRELLKRNISNQEGISDLTDLNNLSKTKDESSKSVFGKIGNVFKEMF